MELSIIVGSTQSVVSRLFLTVRNIVQKEQRLIKENLLCFGPDNTMFFGAFSGISIIPVKASDLRQFNHMRILPSYTSVASSDNKLFLSDQGKLSLRLLAQPPRQSTLAPEQERYGAIRSCQYPGFLE
jgi:hypothetical protein